MPYSLSTCDFPSSSGSVLESLLLAGQSSHDAGEKQDGSRQSLDQLLELTEKLNGSPIHRFDSLPNSCELSRSVCQFSTDSCASAALAPASGSARSICYRQTKGCRR